MQVSRHVGLFVKAGIWELELETLASVQSVLHLQLKHETPLSFAMRSVRCFLVAVLMQYIMFIMDCVFPMA